MNYWKDGEQELIENYELAKADNFKGWSVHHRLELNEDGTFRYTRQQLKDKGLYFERPAKELVYLKHSEHSRLHSKSIALSEETKRKMSDASKGRIFNDEWKKHISDSKLGVKNPMYGKHPSEETRRKTSEALKGHSVSIESRRKISETLKGERHPFYGKHLSEESRRKISEALKGERHPFYGKHPSEETRIKISEAKKGHSLSIETRKKMSEARKGERHPFYGKHHSEETRRKMSEARKRYYANKRAQTSTLSSANVQAVVES